MERKPFSLRSRFRSLGPAVSGIIAVLRYEHNFRIQLVVAGCVVVTGFYVDLTSGEWVMILLAICLVLTTEMLNSAVEKLVDLCSPEYNQLAGLIKDICAGAVLISSIIAILVGFLVFIPKFSGL